MQITINPSTLSGYTGLSLMSQLLSTGFYIAIASGVVEIVSGMIALKMGGKASNMAS